MNAPGRSRESGRALSVLRMRRPARWVYGGETRQHTPEEQTEVQRIRETFAARAAGYELYADSHNKAEWRKVA